jgi:Ca-activated chloride channel family protein
MGNYNDVLMEQLANKADGQYAYVDDIDEAKRIFVEYLTGTLQVIARDVKIQFDFNKSTVKSYRLLGYENRDVKDKDFRVDTVDGGEVGSGHMCTALYEIKLKPGVRSGSIGKIFLRYKSPDKSEVLEIAKTVLASCLKPDFESTSDDFRTAVTAAEFAEILRGSFWAKGSSLSDLLLLATDNYLSTKNDQSLELLEMIMRAMKCEDAIEKG